MANRIPQYGEPQVQERPLGIPNVPTDQPLSAFGGGQAAEDVTRQSVGLAGDIERDQQRRYQEQYQHGVNLQALEISNQLTAEATRAKNELSQRQGKSALGGREQTLLGYDKFYQGIERNLTNDDVKRVAYAHFLQHKEGLDAFATPYEAGQLKEYDNNELLASMKVQQESAAADPTPANVSVASMSQKLALEEFAQRNGYGKAWLEEKQQTAGSATHLSALRSMVASGNDLYAKRFYEDNKGEFVGNDAITAAHLVEDGSFRGQAQREVSKIFTGSMAAGESGPPQMPTEKETYDAVDKIEDPKLQDMVRTRVREKWADIKRINHDSEMEDITKAADIIEGNPTVDAIPVDLYERLPMSAKAAITRRIKQIKDGMGPQPISDAYLGYVRESAVDPDKFVKRNFAAMRDEITAKEAEELTKDQASIIKGDERSARKRAGFLTVEEMMKGRMAALSITDQNDKDMLMTALNRDYWTWRMDEKNAGHQITPAEAQVMVSGLLGRKRAWWKLWGKELTPVIRNIEDVPAADRAAIERQLRSAGQTPTEGRILEIYEKSK